jgi:hypothetical protein
MIRQRKYKTKEIQILEEKLKVGPFGGKDYFWPDIKEFTPSGNEWVKDGITVHGEHWRQTYQLDSRNFVFVDINAESWVNSGGKLPASYAIYSAHGNMKKTGKLRNFDKSGMKTIAKEAKSFGDAVIRKAISKMPKISGWKTGYDVTMDDYWYENKPYKRQSVMVHFDNFLEVIFDREEGEYSLSNEFLDLPLEGKWRSVNDAKKIMSRIDKKYKKIVKS